MKLNLIWCLFAVCLLGLVGCAATHKTTRTGLDPENFSREECVETGNGSTDCEQYFESKIPGASLEYNRHGHYRIRGGAHPPVTMAPPQEDLTEAERAMEDIPGGFVILHPSAPKKRRQPQPNSESATKDDVRILGGEVISMQKRMEQIEKKQGGDKEPSSGEAAPKK